MSPETRSFFEKRKGELKADYDAWQKTYAEWKSANPEKAKLLEDAKNKVTPSVDELLAAIPEFDASKSIATREAGSVVIQPIADKLPMYLTGAADLFGSTKNYIKKVRVVCLRGRGPGLVVRGWLWDGRERTSRPAADQQLTHTDPSPHPPPIPITTTTGR